MIRLSLVLCLLGGCIKTVRFGDDPLAGLVSLTITPVETTIAITDLGDAPTTVEYTALGTYDDDTVKDITAYVGWGVDNPGPGSFVAAGRYRTSQRAGGHVTVRALAGSLEATAKVDVFVTVTVVDNVFPPPVGAEALFAPGTPIVTGDSRAPAMLYPSPATKFPQGLARILFQYTPGRSSNNAFRIRFDSDVLHLTVLTGTERWQPDAAIWDLISLSHWGAETQLVIEAAATTDPGTLFASPAVPLWFSRTSPDGVIYYWSEATNGVMRALPSSTSATKLYPEQTDTTCAGCHAVTRDGSVMALGYNGEKQRTITLGDLATVDNAADGRAMGWAAFSPAGDMVVVAEKGTLVLLDAATGKPIGPDGGRVLAAKATHPDWSPDGAYLAVALSNDVANLEVKAASIARIPFTDGTWGAPEILVAANGDNNYFPKWSPDGRYLAYVHATSGSRGAPSAELRLIAAGSGTPIPLRLASHRVGALDDVPDLASSMPTWAPGGDNDWLAFASTRPYGAVRAVSGSSQIWITGIDLTLADQGLDPSAPAFWLPAQDIRVRDHNPVWAPVPIQTE